MKIKEISQEQIDLLIKEIIALPDASIVWQSYDDHPQIIKVIGRFPHGTVAFRHYEHDYVIGIEMTPANGYTKTVKIQYPKGFWGSSLF